MLFLTRKLGLCRWNEWAGGFCRHSAGTTLLLKRNALILCLFYTMIFHKYLLNYLNWFLVSACGWPARHAFLSIRVGQCLKQLIWVFLRASSPKTCWIFWVHWVLTKHHAISVLDVFGYVWKSDECTLHVCTLGIITGELMWLTSVKYFHTCARKLASSPTQKILPMQH